MARRRHVPARPLHGYRDVGQEVRHSRRNVVRAWVVLAALMGFYLLWTLLVYFFEPGIR